MRRTILLVVLLAGWATRAWCAAPFDPFAAIGIDADPGAAIPAATVFRDEQGREVRIGQYFGARPLLVVPVYYKCPNICGATLAWVFENLGKVTLRAGRDYELVVFSIDPRETPSDARRAETKASGKAVPLLGVHFLTGSKSSIAALAHALGFRYEWDPDLKQYAHPVGMAVADSKGHLTHWLYGFSYRPADIMQAVEAAEQERPLPLGQKILLLCHIYNPVTGKYTLTIWMGFRIAGALLIVGLVGFVARMSWKRRRTERLQGGRA